MPKTRPQVEGLLAAIDMSTEALHKHFTGGTRPNTIHNGSRLRWCLMDGEIVVEYESDGTMEWGFMRLESLIRKDGFVYVACHEPYPGDTNTRYVIHSEKNEVTDRKEQKEAWRRATDVSID